jgi:tetratricopeptide (TPR) repeat protein
MRPALGENHLYTKNTMANLVSVLKEQGKLEEARNELLAASQLSPTETAPRYLLALVDRQSKALPQSIKRLEEVVKLDPQNSDALFLLGRNWFESGDLEKAANHWKEALRANPDHWESLYHLANVLPSGEKEAEKYQESLRALQSRHRLNHKVDLLLRLAQEAAAARNWPGSIAYLQEGLKDCNHCGSARELHRAFGLVYSQTGNLAAALKELQAVLELRPTDKSALELKGRIEGAKEEGCDSPL